MNLYVVFDANEFGHFYYLDVGTAVGIPSVVHVLGFEISIQTYLTLKIPNIRNKKSTGLSEKFVSCNIYNEDMCSNSHAFPYCAVLSSLLLLFSHIHFVNRNSPFLY